MKTTNVKYTNIHLCRNCKGAGYIDDCSLDARCQTVCDVCGGSGKIKKTTNVTITIEPA